MHLLLIYLKVLCPLDSGIIAGTNLEITVFTDLPGWLPAALGKNMILQAPLFLQRMIESLSFGMPLSFLLIFKNI